MGTKSEAAHKCGPFRAEVPCKWLSRVAVAEARITSPSDVSWYSVKKISAMVCAGFINRGWNNVIPGCLGLIFVPEDDSGSTASGPPC